MRNINSLILSLWREVFISHFHTDWSVYGLHTVETSRLLLNLAILKPCVASVDRLVSRKEWVIIYLWTAWTLKFSSHVINFSKIVMRKTTFKSKFCHCRGPSGTTKNMSINHIRILSVGRKPFISLSSFLRLEKFTHKYLFTYQTFYWFIHFTLHPGKFANQCPPPLLGFLWIREVENPAGFYLTLVRVIFQVFLKRFCEECSLLFLEEHECLVQTVLVFIWIFQFSRFWALCQRGNFTILSFFYIEIHMYLRFEPHPGLQVVKMFSKNKTFFTTVSCKLYEYLTPPFPDSFLLILWSELINFSSKQIFITNKNLLFAFYHKHFM